MKALLVASSIVLLLASCASPQQTQINFIPMPAMSYSRLVDNRNFTIISRDMRSAQYVALVDSGRQNIKPVHAAQNVSITLENALLEQLQSQGYRSTVTSVNSIELEVQEALVSVKHSALKNEMDSKVVVKVTAETPRGKLVKTYTGTAKRSGLLSASMQNIEQVLNDTTNLVLKEISTDRELKNYMKEHF